VTIDPTNTLLATAACPVKREEFFVAGTEPDDYCPMHGGEPAAAPATTPPLPTSAPVPKP
jgi:hypothetical protein